MKLVRYGKKGQEKPGLIDADGKLRDLSSIIDDIGPQQLADKSLAKLAKINPARLPLVRGKPRYGVPLAQVGKFIGIGMNYSDHAAEVGAPIPAEPIIFMKATTSLAGANDTVMLPKGSEKSDWEVELGVIIGTVARKVPVDKALSHVAGYCLANDVSERDWQTKRGNQWGKGKSFDGFGPIGPWLVTRDEVPNPQALGMWLDVNGKRFQTSNTDQLIFNVPQVVSYISQFMTLLPGDVISTGTPHGVGLGLKPPVFLQPGDCVTLGMDSLGEQKQNLVAYS